MHEADLFMALKAKAIPRNFPQNLNFYISLYYFIISGSNLASGRVEAWVVACLCPTIYFNIGFQHPTHRHTSNTQPPSSSQITTEKKHKTIILLSARFAPSSMPPYGEAWTSGSRLRTWIDLACDDPSCSAGVTRGRGGGSGGECPSPSVPKTIPSPRAENQGPSKKICPKKGKSAIFWKNLSLLWFLHGKIGPLFC